MNAVIPAKGGCINDTLRYENAERFTDLNAGRSARAPAGVVASSVRTGCTPSVISSGVVAAAAGRTIGAAFCTGDGARAAAAITMAAMESNVSFVMLPLLSIVLSWSI
jgi:hypothetical protein